MTDCQDSQSPTLKHQPAIGLLYDYIVLYT